MEKEALGSALDAGEGAQVEFKRCGSLPGHDVFETICSFANHFGGSIYLGVTDKGEVEGVGGRSLELQRNIASVVRNPSSFKPSPVVGFDEGTLDGKAVLRVWVPEGPELYRYKGVIYDRVADADVRVDATAQIAALAVRKQQLYTEGHIFPHLSRQDLRDDLIARARRMAAVRRPGHPWALMSDDELLRSSRLWGRDAQTGEEGYNRACVLLLGTDEAILSCCPAYRTDAVFSRGGADRYDDRELVATNLLDSYDRLMAFCRKHVDDPFVLEGDARVSARDIVCRELVANTLVHREYLSPVPARLTIDGRGIETLNASKPAFEGRLDPGNLMPVPKNPVIANFFLQVGLCEQLGSGTRNLYEYAPMLFGSRPMLEEGQVFRAFVADERRAASDAADAASASFTGVDAIIMDLLSESETVTSREVAQAAGVTVRTANEHLRKLVGEGLLEAQGSTNRRRYVRMAKR